MVDAVFFAIWRNKEAIWEIHDINNIILGRSEDYDAIHEILARRMGGPGDYTLFTTQHRKVP